jgi:transcriptional regulator with XRE-family HTH domain
MAINSNPSVLTLHTNRVDLYNAATEQENNIVGQHIAKARNQAGISLAKFSTLLESYGVNVSAAAISKWELGKAVPSAYQLLAVSQALQMEDDLYQYTSTYVPALNEAGMKKVAEYKADLIASGKYKPAVKPSTVIKFIEMPVSNLAVSAGTGEFLDEGNFEMVSFPESSVPRGAEFGIKVSGDSMEPVYHNGQIVWVQQCSRVNVGEVGIFIYDGDGYLKVYDEQEPDEDDREYFMDSSGTVHMQPIMISYNQKYEPRLISAHAGFQVVGRVL